LGYSFLGGPKMVTPSLGVSLAGKGGPVAVAPGSAFGSAQGLRLVAHRAATILAMDLVADRELPRADPQ
jgi:hypothetical protein